MKHKLLVTPLMMALVLALASTAAASTTWYVNGVTGNDTNACTSPTTACKTIGHAISLAASGDSIKVASATYTEHLAIFSSVKIFGSGPTTIIDGGGVGTVVTISNGAHVTLSKMTIRHGYAPAGGGIYNSGTLLISASTLSGNHALHNCGTNCNMGQGGAIFNAVGGALTISSSTISGNSAGIAGDYFWGGGRGRGIANGGTLTINKCTISGNTAWGGYGAVGGGIESSGTLTINNSTISENSAHGTHFSSGGGIDGAATLQNSIAAYSPWGGNCSGSMTSLGYNLSSDNTCNFTNTGDLNNTDPMLGTLQYNGGPTQTMALPSGSPAVDAGNPSGCTDSLGHLLNSDQRGKPRPDPEDTGGCDIGAYESQSD